MMKNASLSGAAIICVAIFGVGFVLHQQSERHFSESQRWLEVCKKQLGERLKIEAERMRNDSSIPEEVRKNAQRGIDGWDEDYLYSQCYKEFHAGL